MNERAPITPHSAFRTPHLICASWLLLKILLHPLRFAQERIDAWVLVRVKREPGPVQVPRHRVYILPTRFGWTRSRCCCS